MFEHIRISFQSIFAHKLRSALTMLGVIIGIAAIIAIVSIIEGQSEALKSSMIGLGNNTINVVYESTDMIRGRGEDHYYYETTSYMAAPPIEEETVEAIRSYPMVNQISLYHESWNTQAYHMTNSSYPQMFGVDETFLELFPIYMVEGRTFRPGEFDSKNQIILISEGARDELFPDGDAVNQLVDLSGIPFRVVGVFSERTEVDWLYGGWSQPKIYVPKGVWPLLEGFDSPTQIAVQATSSDHIQEAGELAAIHLNSDLSPYEMEAAQYTVADMEAIAEEMAEFNRAFALLLGGIASISLLVGGIGVMNIMLVSVTERTREIGIKKALGAKRHVILLQFLTEAVVLTSLGGALGILLGLGGAKVISSFIGMPFIISLPAVIGGLLFSMIVGIIFGFLPSFKASNLQPVDALRYE
ncbi:ABC transporter permease [Halalkalibacterium halodurans]|uniref:ABC transporter (ATP-binding protein) n=1 Tax=Halalkalibacterium halodurans (strain ATCC BAA-125 / DSM 18197 / FERM 7344 / JCM 9153 / C-125) TaxID=272558 RepID=Q9K6Q4_HALH5|nr:ABC transporter permease [Halalkalibacterium halodurans]MED3646426.1 ABC transporter permease [Halalkalibacterium halodurans]MED4081986.1 ABC transporter permease [Halalkalibacterium halodurans]MED4083632.1 ABC transporter permease [Halalkalibacterium halodurans]MED4106614.1 ABC transporter permease [Halalkalibacterium halodurans]MED4107876.1 ABC transporter permease [Halalkalibacterium halodurans]